MGLSFINTAFVFNWKKLKDQILQIEKILKLNNLFLENIQVYKLFLVSRLLRCHIDRR